MLHTSVTPEGRFRVGIHTPCYRVRNLREHDHPCNLGSLPDGRGIDNKVNFPASDINIERARPVYEIVNALPFRGCTFIDTGWAAARAEDPGLIRIRAPQPVSLRRSLGAHIPTAAAREIIVNLPLPLRYALAATSTDSKELVWLAESCCRLLMNAAGEPIGLLYEEQENVSRAVIHDSELFETVANNPHLPDSYKEVMVLRPGAQGDSEIVGDFQRDRTEVFEYLRNNSYIPFGHYAANFAHTAIRYRITDLSATDMEGLRFLYYQRVFVSLAERLGIDLPVRRRRLTAGELETLRREVVRMLAAEPERLESLATLWGWNFGYDFSGTGYRLHASHQMIHQQYALVPQWVDNTAGGRHPAYGCGDQVAEVGERYRFAHDSDFFTDYLRAIAANTRTDGGAGQRSLVVWQDDHVLLFVPKAQVSQWELQLMVIADTAAGPVGNVVEADAAVRLSIDLGILKAQQVLAGLGAALVTSIEYPKRFGRTNGQRLLYAFLPKLPWSMGAFSEAQGRYILGHYPEDFALACRRQLR